MDVIRFNNRFFLTAILFVLLLICNCFSQSGLTDTKIYGVVSGSENKQIFGANIVIEGTIEGATTDSSGYYEFETSKDGKQTLIFTAIGYNEIRRDIEIQSGVPQEVNIRLSKTEIVTDEILVTASTFTSGQQSQVTITPLEIVRIPGSDADLFRAITTFPGSNQVDEGSRISVRGGDPGEVLTILDQASLYHPFIFDDDFNSSSYTTINPWGLKGISFSSGGFSAKYGNILSAVLELKSYEIPQGTGMWLFWGLANASVSGVYRSQDKKLGATFDIGSTFLEPYFKINGDLGAEYNPIPLARGLGGTISYKFSESGFVKFYSDYSMDEIGIRNTSPSYDGFYHGKSNTYFSNLKMSTGIGSSGLLGIGISYSRHRDDTQYGVLNTNAVDSYAKLRADYSHQLSSKIDLNTGAEFEYNEGKFSGSIPLLSYNVNPSAPSMYIDSKNHTGRIGSYIESQIKFTKEFFTIIGVRGDYHTLSKTFNVDPRLSWGYNFMKDNSIRGAIGLYHQYPSLEYYSQSTNNSLKQEEAIHYILGYEINKMDGLFLFRLETYYKKYNNLVLLDNNGYLYNSDGYGYAKGIDVFLKSKITNKYSAWISYSYTDSKRLQYNSVVQSPANYDLTHTVSVVGSYDITPNLTTGITYKVSTGKPYTPIIGSYFDSTQNLYAPVYADYNTGRFPTYQRVDVNLQYIFSLFNKFAVAVFQINNLLNQKNLYGYTYNFDYSDRIEIISTNRRQVYFALGVQL